MTRFARANESVLPLAGFRTRSTAMPRYYFHITNGQESLDNPKGMDLPGNATARQEAVVLASELRHGKVTPGRNWQGWFVSVVDQHGRTRWRACRSPTCRTNKGRHSLGRRHA